MKKGKRIDLNKLLVSTRVMDAELNQTIKKCQQNIDNYDRGLSSAIQSKNKDNILKLGQQAADCERKLKSYDEIILQNN